MYSIRIDRMLAVSRKPVRNSAADTHRYTFWLTLLDSRPPTRLPTQKKLMTMVKVRDNWAALHWGNSAAMGPDSTLHAYTRPDTSNTAQPTMA